MPRIGSQHRAVCCRNPVACIAVTKIHAQSPQPGEAQPPQKVWLPGEVHAGNTRIYVHVFKAGSLGHEHAVVGRVKEGVIHLGATQTPAMSTPI